MRGAERDQRQLGLAVQTGVIEQDRRSAVREQAQPMNLVSAANPHDFRASAFVAFPVAKQLSLPPIGPCPVRLRSAREVRALGRGGTNRQRCGLLGRVWTSRPHASTTDFAQTGVTAGRVSATTTDMPRGGCAGQGV